MLFMERAHILIIQQLINASTLLSSEAIGSVLGLTSKTVRKDIELIDQVLKNAGATVVSKPGLGYRLVVENTEEFGIFLQSFQEKYRDGSFIPRYNEERVHYILHQLLLNSCHIKSETFSASLFISPSTFSGELKTAKDILKRYRLQISHKSGKGLLLTGSEFHRRVAIADLYLLHEEEQLSVQNDFCFELDIKEIRDTVRGIFREKGIHMNMEGMFGICNYLMVAHYRLSSGHSVERIDCVYHLYPEELEAVARMAGQFFPVRSSHEETLLAMIIASRRIFGSEDPFPEEQAREFFLLSDEIIRYILRHTGMDPSVSDTCRQLLARELRGLSIRVSMSYELKHNPVLEVKNSSAAYEMAVLAYDFLNQKYRWEISENEIASLSNSFQLFLLEQQKQIEKQRVCLVFQYGKNRALASYRVIESFFSAYIEKVGFLEFDELDQENAHCWDLIITDIPPSKFLNLGISIYQAGSGFSGRDIEDLRQYLLKKDQKLQRFLDSFGPQWFQADLPCRTKEAVLDYASELIAGEEEGTRQLLRHREMLSSGERGNNTAVVSTLYPVEEQTRIGLLVLKKPVEWGQEIAQIIFVLKNGREKDALPFYLEYLGNLVKDTNLVCGLLGAKTLEEAKLLMASCLSRKRNFAQRLPG